MIALMVHAGPQGAERMPKAKFSGWRFTVSERGDGGWPVVDHGYISASTNSPRVVAVCHDRREADAIAAYLSNDPESGRRILADVLSQLDHA